MSFFLHLLRRHLAQYPGRVLTAVVALSVAAALMLALAGAGAALRFKVGGRLGELFPEERLRLESGRAALGPIALEGRPITDAEVQALSQVQGVLDVWPIEPIQFPVQAVGSIFGQTLATDAVIHGVPRALVADAISTAVAWRMPDDFDAPLPVVVSHYFVDLYNLGLARASSLPLLNPDTIIGRHFDIILGQSSVGLGTSREKPVMIDSQVLGLTREPSLIGIVIPIDIARAYNLKFAGQEEPRYVQVVLRLAPDADRAAVTARAAELKLVPAGGDLLGEQLKAGVRVASLALGGLALAVLALGLLTFYLLFSLIFHARRADLLALRTLGLTPLQAVALAMSEVGTLAVVSVGIALAANLALMSWASRLAAGWHERLSWLPEDLFRADPLWMLLAGAAILLLTLLPALPMLREVMVAEPGQSIRDR